MRRLLALLAIAACAAAQEVAPEATFRVGTDLIQTSVIAQDAHGKPVADLTREEFQIFDNGIPQEIRLFDAGSEAAITGPPAPKAPNVFTNQREPSTGSRSGYAVILIDTLHTNFGDPAKKEEGSGAAINRTLRLLRSMPAGPKIALYALQRKLVVICEFTSDRSLLEQRLRSWKVPIDMPSRSLDILGEAGASASVVGEATRIDSLQRVSASNDEMPLVADHLAGIPGRKNLIWIADVFPISGAALQKFSDAGIAIYPVDAWGVCDYLFCPPRPVDAMNAIASFTGGLAYYKRNDLDVAMREALDDGRVSYTVGFYQSGNDRSPQTHHLTIRVTRPGVVLRYRVSYQTSGSRNVARDPRADALRALNLPADTATIPIKLHITPARDHLSLHVLLDVGALDLVPDRGFWTGKVQALARFTDAEGRLTGDASDQTMTLHLRQATYDKAAADGLPYDLQLKIPPAASQLKLLFMNPATRKIGTLTIPLSEVDSSKR